MTPFPTDAQQRAAVLTNQGAAALRAGQRDEALNLLRQAIQLDPQSEQAWLFMAGAVQEPDRRKYCLERVLQLNPQNELAKRGLASLVPAQPPAPAPEPAPPPEPAPVKEESPGWASNPRTFAEVMQQRETRPKIELPDLSTLDRPRSPEPEAASSTPPPTPTLPPDDTERSGSSLLRKRRLPESAGNPVQPDRSQIMVERPGSRINPRLVIGALVALVVVALIVIGVVMQPPAPVSAPGTAPTGADATPMPTAEATPMPTAEATAEATAAPTPPPIDEAAVAQGISVLDQIERDLLSGEQRTAALNTTLETFERAVAVRPDDPKLIYYRGVTNWWLVRDREARADLTEATDLFAGASAQNPNDAELPYLRGRAFFLLDAYEQAIAHFTRAIELRPDFGDAYHQRARARYRVGDLGSCIADNIIAERYLPDDPLIFYRRALAYFDQGDNDRALADYRKALELDDQSGFATDAYRMVALILKRQGQFEDAAQAISTAIDRLPNEIGLRRERAEIYLELDQIDAAEADIDAAAQVDPNRPEIFYLRGRVAAAQGEHVQAVEAYSAAIERNAEYAEAYEARGDAYVRLRQNPRALDDYRQAEVLYARQNNDPKLAAVQQKIQALR